MLDEAMTHERWRRESAIFKGHHQAPPHGAVLKNARGIQDQAELDRAEAALVALQEATRPRFARFDLAEIRAVHKHLFGALYAWAGEWRDYTSQRNPGKNFPFPESIEPLLEAQLRALASENLLRGLSPDDFARRAAHHVNQFNTAHPFIEGNGRVTRLFLQDLGRQAGHFVDIAAFDLGAGGNHDWNRAIRKAFLKGEMRGLIRVIRGALRAPRQPEAVEGPRPVVRSSALATPLAQGPASGSTRSSSRTRGDVEP